MQFSFEKFEERGQKSSNFISVTKAFSFGLSSGFYRDNELSKYAFAELFYDQQNKAVAVHFTNEQTAGAFAIIHGKKVSGGSVSAHSFFKAYGIDPAKFAGKYEPSIEKIPGTGKVFVIQLK